MNTKIEFIRARKCVGRFPMLDVYYKSKRLRTFAADDAPQSVRDFIITATRKITQTDKLWGEETIYRA